MDLLTLVAICGPLVSPATTLRIIDVESAGHAYIIHDNTTGASIDSGSRAEASRNALKLIEAGHRIDVGLMQINYEAWLRPTRFSIAAAFDPCTNVRLGTTILSANYAQALRHFSPSSDALTRALSGYNSGSETAGLNYASRVLSAPLHSPPRHSSTPITVAGIVRSR